jgi:hypothetical protein
LPEAFPIKATDNPGVEKVALAGLRPGLKHPSRPSTSNIPQVCPARITNAWLLGTFLSAINCNFRRIRLFFSVRIVASLDRKRLGEGVLWKTRAYTRGVFDQETRRKPLAFAADALSYGV